MKVSTIRQLNEFNAKFYQLTAEEFSKTRGFYWQGWKELLPILQPVVKEKSQFKVLDVGCGNGRFGEFLFRQVAKKKLVYHGLDNSQSLLATAQKKLAPLKFEKEFFTVDVVESLLDQSLENKLPHKKYHLTTLFGVLHHIPSTKLRQELIKTLSNSLTSGGLLVMTAWQFLNDERLAKKQIHPSIVQIDPEELESNDFILDWQRGLTAYRYCHFTDDQEMEELVKNTDLKFLKRYSADGKAGNLNAYLVLQKP